MIRYNRKPYALSLLIACLMNVAHAQEPTEKEKAKKVAAQAGSNPVIGSGTPGRVARWSGVSGSFAYTLGDSNIFEDKFGKIGIGTTAPTSPLTVQGMIETTLGGYKFPDGTVQTTAFNPSQVVRSLNGLTGDVQLAAGENITITPSGNTLTIAATNALSGVAHDATLTGNGTVAMPLGAAVPLILNGSVGSSAGFSGAIIKVTNLAALGGGVGALGGPGGSGVFGIGGDNNSGNGGVGVVGIGGTVVSDDSNTSKGGVGVDGFGGDNNNGFGGDGVNALGGNSSSGRGGEGAIATGGSSSGSNGGGGVIVRGGAGSGAGNSGGTGIEASGGSATNGAAFGLAGRFIGDVAVNGTLSKSAGSFKIDHPLDPENQYLYHSFVESPDMKNIYDGNVVTDENGEALVAMPSYFEALNRDFRYQLTVIGTFAQAIVAEKIKGNRFVIKTNAPNVEVSWQVTGIRQDAFANKNRIPVEEAKPEAERGYYLHPEVFNQPEEKSAQWARDPEMMQKLRQKRLEAELMRKRKSSDR